ncbi:MAG: dockerin type I domain-containing protein [Candidatus Bathyarchaeota archaeon]|jgi:hypothetical protein
MRSRIKALVVLITLGLLLANMVLAQPLELTITTDELIYNATDIIIVDGNLTYGGLPVSDGIVALEVDDPKSEALLVRSLLTGSADPNQTWPVEILEFYPCDSSGNPKYDFNPGGTTNFKIRIRNNAGNPNNVLVILSLVYSNKAPFAVFVMFNSTLSGGQTMTVTKAPAITLPDDALAGNTTVYANVYNQLPKYNGLAYCPERPSWFLIGANGQGETSTAEDGHFTLEISLDGLLVWLGNYTIYANVMYSWEFQFITTGFEVILVADLNGDGRVDMRDVAIVARAFGSEPGDPLWNPIADVTGPIHMVPDGRVDMRDVAFVARAFGVETRTDS